MTSVAYSDPTPEQLKAYQDQAEYELGLLEAVWSSEKERLALEAELRAYGYRKAAFLHTGTPDSDPSDRYPLLLNGEVDENALNRWVEDKLFAADAEINRGAIREGLAVMEAAGAFDPPDIEHQTLEDLEADEDIPELRYRVAGLHQHGGNVIIAAQAKAGKTTFMFNLVKSLVDGCDFLGLPVIPVAEGKRVVYWDAELETVYARAQMMSLNVENKSAVTIVPMKGRTTPLQVDAVKEWTIKHLSELNAEVWVIDTMSRIYQGDEDSNTEFTKWIAIVDEIKRRAGLSEVYIVHHAGHGGEGRKVRSRGASAMLAWPESLWTLEHVNPNDDEDTQRVLKITGRGDLLDSAGYDWDRDSNRIFAAEIVTKGQSKQADAAAFEQSVWDYVTEHGECSITQVVKGLDLSPGMRNKVSTILAGWDKSGQMTSRKGASNATFYSVAPFLNATVQRSVQHP
jgi:hypothetical protein